MSYVALIVGLGLWTLIEYLLHRFVFHERWLGQRGAREHTEHHAKVDWFAPWSSKLLLATPVLLALTALGVPFLGLGAGASLAAGVVAGWLAYEALHRAIHVLPPHGAYARWAWRHHLQHHFGSPKANFGVSSPIWDRVFGTYQAVNRVAVPPRQAQKLPWLLDERGGVRSELASTYLCVQRDPNQRPAGT